LILRRNQTTGVIQDAVVANANRIENGERPVQILHRTREARGDFFGWDIMHAS
jgi:hypothetical protein